MLRFIRHHRASDRAGPGTLSICKVARFLIGNASIRNDIGEIRARARGNRFSVHHHARGIFRNWSSPQPGGAACLPGNYRYPGNWRANLSSVTMREEEGFRTSTRVRVRARQDVSAQVEAKPQCAAPLWEADRGFVRFRQGQKIIIMKVISMA